MIKPRLHVGVLVLSMIIARRNCNPDYQLGDAIARIKKQILINKF